MPMLERGGAQIAFEVYGQGPAILLTHGFGEAADMWRGQIEALSETHKLVLWDMRGHGRTRVPTDPSLYSEAETIADMLGILDAIGADKAIIGGLSLGGYMSLAFTRAHPERVAGLVIVDTGPGFRNDDARARWNTTAVARAEELEAVGFAGRGMRRYAERHDSPASLALAARHMLTQRDARVIESLIQVRTPAVVIVGADDHPFLAASDYMASKIPGARKVVVPSAGHMVNIDQPQAFNDAVVEFLAQLRA